MSVHRKDKRWVVRWREGGHQRSRSFTTKREAAEFDGARGNPDQLREVAAPAAHSPRTPSAVQTSWRPDDEYP